MADTKKLTAMRAEGVRLSDIASRVDITGDKLKVEFTMEDLVKKLGPEFGPGLVSSCGGCNGCTGCSM
jgi:hypothetical protein